MSPARVSLLSLVLALGSVAVLSGCQREAEAAGTPYPLDTCIVSGEKLGNHGDPYVFTKDGQQVKLCCENCLDEFNANADKLLKDLAAKPKP